MPISFGKRQRSVSERPREWVAVEVLAGRKDVEVGRGGKHASEWVARGGVHGSE